MQVLPYSVKHWQWKTLVNSTEDYYIGKKNIGDLASFTSKDTLLAKNVGK